MAIEKVETNELKMSPIQTYLTARALIDPILSFYENPENEKKFEEWKKKRDSEKK